MNHFKAIGAKLPEYGLDAMLITSQANGYYASSFPTTGAGDSLMVVTGKRNYFITDSRYTEAAGKQVKDAELLERANAASYLSFLKQILEENGIRKLGFEDEALTVKTYNEYSKDLNCEFVPASKLLTELRQSKDDEEIENLKAAQRIADKALTQLLEEIRPGMTEKEISARLQYLMKL